MKRRIKGKKSEYIWISWVLLFAFAVAMSALMYNWIFGYTKASTYEIEKRTFDAQECEFVSIGINNIWQDTKNLYIDISNRNNLNIDKVIVRLYNIYGEPIEPLREKRVSIKPNGVKSIDIQKDGVVFRVEVIPVTFKKKVEIICSEKLARIENIEFR
ncbi:MAG: hypothetical protein V1740_02645 [Candidatus Woesearchaeota archaeon]